MDHFGVCSCTWKQCHLFQFIALSVSIHVYTYVCYVTFTYSSMQNECFGAYSNYSWFTIYTELFSLIISYGFYTGPVWEHMTNLGYLKPGMLLIHQHFQCVPILLGTTPTFYTTLYSYIRDLCGLPVLPVSLHRSYPLKY